MAVRVIFRWRTVQKPLRDIALHDWDELAKHIFNLYTSAIEVDADHHYSVSPNRCRRPVLVRNLAHHSTACPCAQAGTRDRRPPGSLRSGPQMIRIIPRISLAQKRRGLRLNVKNALVIRNK